MVSRRGFLKLLGAGAAAVVAAPLLTPPATVLAKPSAPLFIPSQNLDMGVPRRILTATEMPSVPPTALMPEGVQRKIIESAMGRSIAMLMLQDNFVFEHGGKIRAGAEVLVDQQTADRWIRFGVATPGPKAPQDLQLRSAQRMMERQTLKRRARSGDQKADDLLQVPGWNRSTGMGLRV